MGLPNIIINFKSTGGTAIKRSEKGIVAILLKDAKENGFMELESINDIPSELSTTNKDYITRAFIGGISVPKKVIIYVMPVAATEYKEAFDYLETVKFDYVVGPPDITTPLATTMASWIKAQRDTLDKKIKGVLPSTASDHEGIINFDTTDIRVGKTKFTAAQYCSRIAGIIAGTPLKVSCTFTPLSEVDDVPRKTITQISADIDAGKFIIFNDGEKVKVGRGINSLVTTTADKGEEFKKIKIVDILDLIHDDVKKTSEDDYIGKYPNSYDDKCLLITAIKAYYEELERDGLLDKDKSIIDIDIAAQTAYLKSIGKDTSKMNDYDIKSANTSDKVYLEASIKPLDAIEDIKLNVLL